HESVWVVCDPDDYSRVLEALDDEQDAALALRRELAVRVFAHTSAYDAAIAAYLGSSTVREQTPDAASEQASDAAPALPSTLQLGLARVQNLRYGENPDQAAAFYRDHSASGGFPQARQLNGKALSYINLLDADAAVTAVSAWTPGEIAACCIVKHATPCGVAVGASVGEAYRKALATDPVSACGSVIAFNRAVDLEAAELMRG